MTPVTVGLISRTFFYVPFWIAQKRGYFADAGLAIDASILDSAEAASVAMRAGTMHVSIGPPEGVIADVEAGGPLRIIAGNTSQLAHDLIAAPRFKRVEDLRGATIGVVSLTEGSVFHFGVLAAAHGLRPDEYTIVAIGGAPTRWKALQAGTIDAGLQSIPLTYMAMDAGYSNLGPITDYIPDWQFTTTNADMRWVREHEDAAIALLQTLQRATFVMLEEREFAIAVAAEEMQVAPAYAERAWDDFVGRRIMPPDLSVTRTGLARNLDVMERAGSIAADPARTPDRYLDLRYLALANAATARGAR